MRKWLSILGIICCMFFIPMYVTAEETTTPEQAGVVEQSKTDEEIKEDEQSKENESSEKKSDFIIVLDPGHGGSDPGAVRIHNGITYSERDIVLKIAKYCKEELERYANVKVYLTRSNNASILMNRKERTEFALKKKADVIVSLHINSTGDTIGTASGALVYGPYANTKSGTESQKLAKTILVELAKVGLKNRGILVDESLGMIKYPKENGVPGILVEHGFINNADDVSKYLNSNAKLKKLGIADAKGIVEYYNLKEKYIEYEEDAGTMTTTLNDEGTEYMLSTEGVSDAFALSYTIKKKGAAEETIVWKEAKKTKAGQWESNFVIGDYQKKGTYQIEAYVINEDQTQTRVASTEIKVKGPAAQEITTQNINPEAGTFDIQISGLTSEADIQKVTVRVWSQDGMKDAKIYKTTLQEDGTYTANINIKKHNYHYGTYYFYVYAKDANGIVKRFVKKNVEFQLPDLKVKAFANKTEKKYTVSLDQMSGIIAVKIAVWSKKNGQNDLRWYNAKVNKKNRWATSVSIAKHKSSGTYYAEIYGVHEAGVEILLGRKEFKVQAPTIEEITISKPNAKTGKFRVNVKGITAKAGIEKVAVKAWTKDDMSDVANYGATLQKSGNYQAKIDIKKHDGNYGIYKLKIYVKDTRGIIKTKQFTYEFLEPTE